MSTRTSSSRSMRFARAAISGLAGALALSFAGGTAAQAHAPASGTSMSMPSTSKVIALHEAMDMLWTDHVAWTRTVIVDFDANAPNLKPDLARLLQNQVDIGNAIKPYYGAAAGNKLTSLLHSHIMEAVPILAAAKAGNKVKLTRALKVWDTNAQLIAAFLSKANPTAWPLSATTRMMRTHIDLTTNEAVAHLQGKWTADIAAYDEVRAEILMMADTLADGIIKQFPARFAG
jgi:hypothetical protein